MKIPALSSKTQTRCPRCMEPVESHDTQCPRCQQALRRPGDESIVAPVESDDLLEGILQMAEEIGPGDISNSNPEPKELPRPTQPSTSRLSRLSSTDTMASIELDGETPLPMNRKTEETPRPDVIRFACKKCGRKLRARKDKAGQAIKCPKCETKLKVPGRPESAGVSADSGSQPSGLGESNILFADLAKELEAQEKATIESGQIPIGKEPEKPKKTLSQRQFRKLSKVLETTGLLSTDDLSKRADALRDLGKSGDHRAYELLMTDLEHTQLPVRQAAIVGLGELGDSQCVPALVALLDDHSLVIRKAVILALGKIKDPRAIKPLLLFGLDDPQMKFLASEAAADMGENAVQALIELLDDKELGLVLESIVLLGRLKDPRARRALTAVIDERQPLLQCHAIEALGQIADPKSIGPLTRLLQSSDANVRATSASALSKMATDKNIVAPLVKALKDPDEDVVVQAAKGLGESGDKRAGEPLSRLLKSPHEKIRVAAAQALGALGDNRAVPQLLALLEEDSEETKIKVLTALRALKPAHVGGTLLRHLKHPSPAVRRRVVDALGPIGDAEVAEQLEHVLRTDAADEVRMATARALGEIADPASVDCLKEALHNDEFNIRCQAIGALGGIGDEECFSTLLLLLEDQVPEVRFHAATALGEIGNDRAVPQLKELLKDKTPLVVRGASKSLEKLGVADVEKQTKLAQRSKKREAASEVLDTVKSWFPDTIHGQKIILGGALAGLVLLLGAGWFVMKLVSGPPKKVVVMSNVKTLSFLPGGTQVVVGRKLGSAEIWDVDSAKIKKTFDPPGGQRLIATSNPDVFAMVDGSAVRLWSMNDGKDSVEPKSGHAKPITQFVITPDRTMMATYSGDGMAVVWNLTNGEPRGGVRLPPKEVGIFGVSADASLLAGAGLTSGITIWDSVTGEVVKQFPLKSPAIDLCFHPDGKSLVVSQGDGMSIWDLESGKSVGSFPKIAKLRNLQFDPTGKRLVGFLGNVLHIIESSQLQDDKTQPQPKTVPIEAEKVTEIAFSSDGHRLGVGGPEDNSVWVYDLTKSQLLKKLDPRQS